MPNTKLIPTRMGKIAQPFPDEQVPQSNVVNH